MEVNMDTSLKLVRVCGKVYRGALKGGFNCMKEEVEVLKEVADYIYELKKLVQEEMKLSKALVQEETKIFQEM
jgi:hypothetical protein